MALENAAGKQRLVLLVSVTLSCLRISRAGFKCVEALGRIIIRGGPYPTSNAIIYIHLQL